MGDGWIESIVFCVRKFGYYIVFLRFKIIRLNW